MSAVLKKAVKLNLSLTHSPMSPYGITRLQWVNRCGIKYCLEDKIVQSFKGKHWLLCNNWKGPRGYAGVQMYIYVVIKALIGSTLTRLFLDPDD